MFRAMAVDFSVLLLSCSITVGALGSTSLSNINVIAFNHHTHNVFYVFYFHISTSTMIRYRYNSTVADTGAVRLRRYIKQGSGLSPPNEANTLRVTLLPHEPFRRMGCENRSAVAIQAMRQSTVLHCLLHEKNGNLKQSGSRDLGIWQLRERWMDVPFRENDTIDSFLDNIRIDVAERATSVLLSSYEYKSDNSDKLMV